MKGAHFTSKKYVAIEALPEVVKVLRRTASGQPALRVEGPFAVSEVSGRTLELNVKPAAFNTGSPTEDIDTECERKEDCDFSASADASRSLEGRDQEPATNEKRMQHQK